MDLHPVPPAQGQSLSQVAPGTNAISEQAAVKAPWFLCLSAEIRAANSDSDHGSHLAPVFLTLAGFLINGI
jgi:hypothetical protein